MKIDKRKYKILAKSKENERLFNNLLGVAFLLGFVVLFLFGEIANVNAEAPKFVKAEDKTKIVFEATPIVTQITSPDVAKTNETPKVVLSTCSIDKLLQGRFKGQKELILKNYTCSQARKLLALAGTETNFSTAGVGKQNNAWGIKCGSKFCSWDSIETAIVKAKSLIGSYLNLSDEGLLNNKAYCASGCTSWKSSLSYFLSLSK